jgi:hypothetical protein
VMREKASSPDCANSKKRRLLANTPRPRRPRWAERARAACGRKGVAVGLVGLRGQMGRLAAGLIGPKVKEKFFSE